LNGKRPEVVVGRTALPDFYRFCAHNRLRRFFLVADRNTYAVLGGTVETELRERQYQVIPVVLQDNEVLTDARAILKVLLAYDPGQCTFLAIGSGTITDVTRFVSYCAGNAFISLPTAPSVDGYSSANVPMMVDGIKKSRTAHAPEAIFADETILCSAPRRMIVAGFGDMLGKYTSVADWRLGHLLWNEPYDESIALRSLSSVGSCADAARAIGTAAPNGIATLMAALIESGFCMTDFGSSLPASGTEHHYSHFWEMKLLREGRPTILHGAKVGVATILVAGLYEKLRRTSRGEAMELLRDSHAPARDDEVRKIRAAFGPMADEIILSQSSFLDLPPDGFEQLKQKVIDTWSDIQAIAAAVPPPERIAQLVAAAGGPSSPGQLGLNRDDLELAARSAHFLRGHFTVRRLLEILHPGA
jgi:glycerol-1-phosphate dehydrogenase [NAD(P)+]